MKVQSAIDEIKKLQNIICQNSPLDFNIDEVVIRDEFKRWYKDQMPQKSGVYLFSDNSGEILYVGKAIKLSAEIWKKFGAPQLNEETNQPEFIRVWKKPDNLKEKLINGDICIAFVVISPKEMISLIEVYLQTLELPRLNNRIG